MPNPRLIKKIDETLTVCDDGKRLFRAIFREQNKADRIDDNVARIKVSAVISRLSFYYEKIRNSVDYKEEYLHRKNAIERILRRQIVIEGAISLKALDSEEISRHLLTELIQAGYLPNDAVPESKIEEVAKTIGKYLKLRDYSLYSLKHEPINERNQIFRWIIAIAASEIEEQLGRSEVDRVIIEYMYDVLLKNIALPPDSPFIKDKDIQIYLGVHRGLMKFDQDMNSLILFRYYNHDWNDPSDQTLRKIAGDIKSLFRAIHYQLEHPLSKQLNRIISRYTVFFTILRDVIEKDPQGVYETIRKDPKAFPRLVKQACNKRYALARAKLWRAAVRSIIYIFITKSIFVFILEIPVTKFFGENISLLALAVNVSFPVLLLFLIVFFTRLPSDANTERIVQGIEEIIFVEHARPEPFRLSKPRQRGAVMGTAFALMYGFTFFISFGVIIWGLNKIGFNWVSIVIFIFFLALVSFFGIRIRRGARELVVVPPKENILSFFSDFFYVPIILAGKWLSEKFSRINVFVFIMDFIIEAPFKIFMEIAEEWSKYVKERKDDIV